MYRHLAALLIDQERLAEAQQILTMLKEEEFSDYLRGDLVRLDTAATRITYTVLEEDWDQRYLEIQDLTRCRQYIIDSEHCNHPFYWGSFILMGNWL